MYVVGTRVVLDEAEQRPGVECEVHHLELQYPEDIPSCVVSCVYAKKAAKNRRVLGGRESENAGPETSVDLTNTVFSELEEAEVTLQIQR